MRKAPFVALVMGAALAAGPALAADPAVTFCKDEMAKVLGLHGLQIADLQDVQQIKVGKQQPSIVTIAKPKTCEKGELRISMWYTCTLQSMDTVGGCQIKGVSQAPF